ncbi:type II secretion system protein GspL [Desulfurispirillum indicum]|uniref:type II secretion system protein GspL n=1 Tax=Desulfurispirillum indicum TaxID=936456 RepID=UPI001CFB8B2A|nr:type II secretion system protein GspL [Desulfurispirillum indicum]UCZ56753.1 type II secretion system protein GspL [Desulfurispirillum indicum]
MDTLFLQMLPTSPQNSGEARWMFKGYEGPDQVYTGRLEDVLSSLPAEKTPRRTVVMVPGEQVLLTSASIPSRNSRYVRQALPYAIEEQLAQDLDEVHIAIGPRRSDGAIATMVVDRERMVSWMERLSACAIAPDVLVPDTLCVPPSPQGKNALWQAWFDFTPDRQRCLLQTDPLDATAVHPSSLGLLLEGYLQSRESQEALPLHVWLPDENVPLEYAALETELRSESRFEVHWNHYHGDPFALQCQYYLERFGSGACPMNLLQGDFRVTRRTAANRLPWALAAGAFLVWFVVEVASGFVQAAHVSRQTQALEDQARQLYRQLFPQEQRIVNIRAQMQSHINRAGQSASTDETFLGLLEGLGNPLQPLLAGGNVTMRHISYSQQRGDLMLEVHFASFEHLEQYRADLESSGFEAEIQSAVADGNIVRSRLILRKRP